MIVILNMIKKKYKIIIALKEPKSQIQQRYNYRDEVIRFCENFIYFCENDRNYYDIVLVTTHKAFREFSLYKIVLKYALSLSYFVMMRLYL